MAGSFRRRLFTIAALAVLACGAAIVAILYLSRTTMDERNEHVRENVTREIERLQGTLSALPPAARVSRKWQSGTLQSGYVRPDERGEVDPVVVLALQRVAGVGDLAALDREADGTPVMVAAAPVPGGGDVYALQPVVAGRETRGLRIVVVVLALLSLGLIVASLRALRAVERDLSTLRASLAALAKDLSAPLARPALRELDEVASGVASLAEELRRAQRERERLTRDLAAGERLAALGRVAAGIAHEVRNPLASMKLRADLARTGGEATPAVARDLDDIASEIARLDRLVSDLLVVSGRRVGPRVDLELGEIVTRRIALLAPWAKEKGVALASEGSARAPVDADSVSRALDNLLRNAVEASPTGGRVEVQVRGGKDDAHIVVTDRGPGVPADRATELFEPFFTTKPDGTGLGLPLARAVANAHDGTLTYGREQDRTVMTLTISASAPPPSAVVS
jgi:signal transduction histidine kinase